MIKISIEFSVIVPMFNNERTIVRALESCINQTCLPKEVIIVDDASADDSYEVVKKWQANFRGSVKIILKRLDVNSGPSMARNVGWNLATGDYVSFLDADDIYTVDKLETVKTALEEQQNLVLLGHASAVKGEYKQARSELNNVTVSSVLKKNLFTTPAVIVKRSIPERFDESMRFTEDHDLWLRITKQYNETYYLDKVLTLIDRPVRSEGGQSANLWAMRSGEIKMYRKYCKANGLMVLFPMFLVYSLAKHTLKLLKGRS